MATPDWINYDEKVVGENHPSLTDVQNRPGKTLHANMLVEHDADGKHTFSSESVADEAEITFDTGKTGKGWAMAGDDEEFIEFRFTAAGVVTVISNSANAINTDTDGNLCVYDAGSGIAIKNRLGATKTVRYVVQYS
jgi:hypothetical protein